MSDYQLTLLNWLSTLSIIFFCYMVLWLGFEILDQLKKATSWMQDVDDLDKQFESGQDSKDGRTSE
jgi:TRAP-type C4-dicarboxylate transport system permease small subunit